MKKVTYLIAIGCLVSSLSGCLPAAALVVGATAGGAIVYDKRPAKVMVRDREISDQAQEAINEDSILRGRAHIAIATFNYVVLMVGQAETPELRDRAYNLVSRVKYVRRVYNEVSIGKPTPTGKRASDTWITTKVKSAMLTKSGLSSSQIKVVTENGVVYLMGLVSPQQAALAVEAARRVNGVTKVVKVFQYD